LIQAVDAFVVYDDVSFIKSGWINRNFILSQEDKSRITLQLQGASPNLLINQVKVGNNKKKILKSIQHSYFKAPQYATLYPFIEDILLNDEVNIAKYLGYGLRIVCDYWILGLNGIYRLI